MAVTLIQIEKKAMDALLFATNIGGALRRNADNFSEDGALYKTSKGRLEDDMVVVQRAINTWRSVHPRHPNLVPLAKELSRLYDRLDEEELAWARRTRAFWVTHATTREQLRNSLHVVYWYAARYEGSSTSRLCHADIIPRTEQERINLATKILNAEYGNGPGSQKKYVDKYIRGPAYELLQGPPSGLFPGGYVWRVGYDDNWNFVQPLKER